MLDCFSLICSHSRLPLVDQINAAVRSPDSGSMLHLPDRLKYFLIIRFYASTYL